MNTSKIKRALWLCRIVLNWQCLKELILEKKQIQCFILSMLSSFYFTSDQKQTLFGLQSYLKHHGHLLVTKSYAFSYWLLLAPSSPSRQLGKSTNRYSQVSHIRYIYTIFIFLFSSEVLEIDLRLVR